MVWHVYQVDRSSLGARPPSLRLLAYHGLAYMANKYTATHYMYDTCTKLVKDPHCVRPASLPLPHILIGCNVWFNNAVHYVTWFDVGTRCVEALMVCLLLRCPSCTYCVTVFG
jgi:hypothetical protein